MKGAKGKADVVDAVGSIQQLILKPEWKELIQDVLENEQLTERSQESIVAVANAIVTPLSLLVFAADLPPEQIEACKTLWKDTMGRIDDKCEPKGQQDEIIDQGEEKGPGAKRELNFQEIGKDTEDGSMDNAFVEDLPETDPPNEQETAETEENSPTEQATIANNENQDTPPSLNSSKASKSKKKGLKRHQILASQAAKKGLVTGKTFHERTRSTITVL